MQTHDPMLGSGALRWQTACGLAFALATCVPAQTYIVDAMNGPGAQFTSIAAAIAAVPSGAVLLVRPGSYLPFSINGKGLSILGTSGVVITNIITFPVTISISGTNANQPVVLRHLHLQVPSGGAHRLICTNCAGPLIVQAVTFDTTWGPNGRLTAQQCSQLYVEASGPFASGITSVGLEITGGSAVVRNCLTSDPCNVLLANASTVQIVDCAFTGLPPVQLAGGLVRAMGTTSLVGFAPGVPAVAGTGTFVCEPTVLAAPIVSTVNTVVAQQGFCTASGGALGTPANASLSGPTGHLGALFLGRVATPQIVPGFQFDQWLANGSIASVGVGVFGAPLAASVQVPANPLLLGTLFGWQGVTFDPARGFAFSTPALFTP